MKKVFQNYPIIWFLVILIAIGLGAGYLFFKSNQLLQPMATSPLGDEHIEVEEKIRQIPTTLSTKSRSKREVKIKPVSVVVPLRDGTRRGGSPWPPDDLDRQSQKGWAQGPTPTTLERKPQIVFVIDDLGYHNHEAELLFSIHAPLTIAVLPQLPYSKFFAEEGKKHGFEIILHQPLEPEDQTEDPGPGLIKADMTVNEIESILEKNLSTVPGAVGMNNHMGSRATRDRSVMYVVAKELKERNLFFLDSLTHSKSVAHDVAFALGIPAAKRDVFLDNEDDYNLILVQIKEAAEIAKENGRAVAIGHIRENTLRAIKDSLPKLEKEGIEITTLKELLK